MSSFTLTLYCIVFGFISLEAEQFHYRLSSTQEDEIRESFLMERLKPFTTVRGVTVHSFVGA